MTLIDISPLIHSGIAVWPGDQGFERHVAMDMQTGSHLTLSSIRTTVHLGAHADAPNHYVKEGQGISHRSLDYYYGPCQVMDVCTSRGRRILPGDLDGEIVAPRVLLRTNSFPDPDEFNEDFCALSEELVEYLHGCGVRLIGIDTPSIDLFSDKVLQSHNAVARHDMAVLEGVVLSHVSVGNYLLIALPLRLKDSDASPVRAALVPVDNS